MLELFSGAGIMSKTYEGKAIPIDFNLKVNDGIQYMNMDLLNPDWEYFKSLRGKIKVVWASPPCTTFSVASIGTHWTGGGKAYIPKTEKCKNNILLVENTLRIIELVKPDFWFIENPRGVLRKLGLIGGIRHTVTYCQYGEERMKPTDIWTNCESWIPRKMCKNGMSCHVAAPRGSKTGTQGLKNNYERSKLPAVLCKEIVEAVNYGVGQLVELSVPIPELSEEFINLLYASGKRDKGEINRIEWERKNHKDNKRKS